MANKETNIEEQNLELRRAVQSAVAAIKASELTRGLGQVTFEELCQEQIDLIEGTGTDTRPSILARIDRTEADVLAAVEQIKQLPAPSFLTADANQDVNTPPEG